MATTRLRFPRFAHLHQSLHAILDERGERVPVRVFAVGDVPHEVARDRGVNAFLTQRASGASGGGAASCSEARRRLVDALNACGCARLSDCSPSKISPFDDFPALDVASLGA